MKIELIEKGTYRNRQARIDSQWEITREGSQLFYTLNGVAKGDTISSRFPITERCAEILLDKVITN